MIERNDLYVDGAWTPSSSTSRLEVTDASTEEVLATIPAGAAEDVDRAVAAARAALPGWAALPPAQRAGYCASIADALVAKTDELAALISREVGTALPLSKAIQVGLAVNSFRAIPDLVDQVEWESTIGNSLVVREPVGVVGAITPWNFPLHQVAAKVAFALGAGCTVVVKPSEVAPLSAFALADIVSEVGLPPGVFNLVTGTGSTVGEALTSNPGVDMVSFTGSTTAGKRVAERCAERVAKVALELGGKGPNVILPGADLARAVRDGVGKAFLNSGQTCSALTRMLVPSEVLPEVEALAADAAGSMTVGDPAVKGTKLGPLVSQAQWERVQSYIAIGLEEGAKAVVGGLGKPEGLERGFFTRPTVFTSVTPDMRIAREEIFGPVLCLIAYDSVDEAVEIANGTDYGLSAGVWAGERDDAMRVARLLHAGQVEVNGGAFNPNAPFGGYKQSGLGRECSRFGLEEFLEVKSLQL